MGMTREEWIRVDTETARLLFEDEDPGFKGAVVFDVDVYGGAILVEIPIDEVDVDATVTRLVEIDHAYGVPEQYITETIDVHSATWNGHELLYPNTFVSWLLDVRGVDPMSFVK